MVGRDQPGPAHARRRRRASGPPPGRGREPAGRARRAGADDPARPGRAARRNSRWPAGRRTRSPRGAPGRARAGGQPGQRGSPARSATGSSSLLAVPRLASLAPAMRRAASSVMSMPTGHQAMHRPQPTQPDLPNWSCQVPSLWVIHCRYRLAPTGARCRRACRRNRARSRTPSAASARRARRSGRSRPRCRCRSTSGRPSCSSRRTGSARRRRPSAVAPVSREQVAQVGGGHLPAHAARPRRADGRARFALRGRQPGRCGTSGEHLARPRRCPRRPRRVPAVLGTLGEGQVVAGPGAGAGAHRGAEAHPARLGAVHRDDEQVLAAARRMSRRDGARRRVPGRGSRSRPGRSRAPRGRRSAAARAISGSNGPSGRRGPQLPPGRVQELLPGLRPGGVREHRRVVRRRSR